MTVKIYRMEPFIEAFELASIMDATTSPSADVMEHPLADGSVIADHRIINPIEISLRVILHGDDYESVYADIDGAFRRGDLFAISTSGGVYENMVMTDIPGRESPEKVGAIEMSIGFKRADFVRPRYVRLSPDSVAAPSDAPTVDRGDVTPRASTLSRIFG